MKRTSFNCNQIDSTIVELLLSKKHKAYYDALAKKLTGNEWYCVLSPYYEDNKKISSLFFGYVSNFFVNDDVEYIRTRSIELYLIENRVVISDDYYPKNDSSNKHRHIHFKDIELTSIKKIEKVIDQLYWS